MGTYGDNQPQDGDVLLYHSDTNSGDVTIEGGITEMTALFNTMGYLTLFGGNEDDPGGDDKTKQWWGNFTEPDEARQYRSELQHILIGLPASSGNLLLAEQAATRDLQKEFVTTGIASGVEVTATIPIRNKINVTCVILAEGERHEFTFTENWDRAVK